MSDPEVRIPVTLKPLRQTKARLRRYPPSMVKILGEGDAEIFAILSDGTVRGAIEDAGPAAQRFMTELRGMAEAIRVEAQAEAWDEGHEAAQRDATRPANVEAGHLRAMTANPYRSNDE